MSGNRIIVPANFTVDIIIRYDPIKGGTELQIRNRSNLQISMFQIAGLLAEHNSQIMRNLLSGKIKIEEVPDPDVKPNGGDNNAA